MGSFLIWLHKYLLFKCPWHIMWCAMLSKKVSERCNLPNIWHSPYLNLNLNIFSYFFLNSYILSYFFPWPSQSLRLVKEATKEWVSQNWKYFFRMPRILNMWVASANHGNLNPVIQKIARVLTWVSNLGGLTFRKTWMWCASKKFGTSTMPWL